MDYKEICLTNAIKAKELAEEIVERRDNYVMAKKLTLMARSLDPELNGISQLLDVVDVFIYYYEQKIGNEPDYYSILGVDPSVDDEALRRHYRKRALSLHPDKNNCVAAAGAFSLVVDAFGVLSNKTKRFHYDIYWLNSRIEKEIQLGESLLLSTSNGVNSSSNNDNNANPKDQNNATPPPDQLAASPSHQPSSPPNQPDSTPHQPATHPEDHPAPSPEQPATPPPEQLATPPPDQPAPPPPDQPAPPPTNSSPLSAEDQGRDQTEPSSASSPSSKSSKVNKDERSVTDSLPTPTPDDNHPKSSRFWTICYACRMQYEYLRVYLRRKLRCPRCQNSFLAVEMSVPGTRGAPFPRKSSVQRGNAISSKPTMSRNSNAAARGTTNKKRKERSPENINVYRRRAKRRPSKAEEEK